MSNTIKKIKEYDTVIQKHIDKKDCVQVNRIFKNKEKNLSGFILNMSRDFILLQIAIDFRFDGYAIIPKDQFDSIRCNQFDKTEKRILKAEGEIDSFFGLNILIDLSSWQTLFNDLKGNDYHVIIECEDLDEPFFEIGPIKRVSKNRVSVQYYNPSGILEDKPTTRKFDIITIVKFGCRYSTTFRKYLRTKANKVLR